MRHDQRVYMIQISEMCVYIFCARMHAERCMPGIAKYAACTQTETGMHALESKEQERPRSRHHSDIRQLAFWFDQSTTSTRLR